MPRRHVNRCGNGLVSAIFYLIVAIQVAGVSAPLWEHRHWDLLAYLGAAYELDGRNHADMHEAIYRAAREGSTEAAFRHLTERPSVDGKVDYRVAAYTSADVFAEQLPFYMVKRFYPAAIWALSKLGVPVVLAATIITVSGYLAVSAVLFFWLRKFLTDGLSLGITGALMTSIFMLPLAFLRTPDTWAAALVAFAFFQAASGRFATSIAVAAVAITVRPDAVLALGAMCVFAAWRREWLVAAIGAALGAGVYLAVTAGAYPWTTFFYHAFVDALRHPANFQSPLGTEQYLAIYAKRIVAAPFLNPVFPAAMVLGGLTVFMRIQRGGWQDTYAALVLLALGCMLAHWLVFPAGLTRHQMPYYLVIVAALAFHFAEAFTGRRGSMASSWDHR